MFRDAKREEGLSHSRVSGSMLKPSRTSNVSLESPNKPTRSLHPFILALDMTARTCGQQGTRDLAWQAEIRSVRIWGKLALEKPLEMADGSHRTWRPSVCRLGSRERQVTSLKINPALSVRMSTSNTLYIRGRSRDQQVFLHRREWQRRTGRKQPRWNS